MERNVALVREAVRDMWLGFVWLTPLRVSRDDVSVGLKTRVHFRRLDAPIMQLSQYIPRCLQAREWEGHPHEVHQGETRSLHEAPFQLPVYSRLLHCSLANRAHRHCNFFQLFDMFIFPKTHITRRNSSFRRNRSCFLNN